MAIKLETKFRPYSGTYKLSEHNLYRFNNGRNESNEMMHSFLLEFFQNKYYQLYRSNQWVK